MKRKLGSLTGIVHPYSLEERNDYMMRFEKNPEMRAVFPTMFERYEIADAAFQERWGKATVTIARADGGRLFVD